MPVLTLCEKMPTFFGHVGTEVGTAKPLRYKGFCVSCPRAHLFYKKIIIVYLQGL